MASALFAKFVSSLSVESSLMLRILDCIPVIIVFICPYFSRKLLLNPKLLYNVKAKLKSGQFPLFLTHPIPIP